MRVGKRGGAYTGFEKSNWSKTGKIYSSLGRARAAVRAAIDFKTIKSEDEVEIVHV